MSVGTFDPLAAPIAELRRWHREHLSGSLEFVFGDGVPKHMNRKDSAPLPRQPDPASSSSAPQIDATRQPTESPGFAPTGIPADRAREFR